MYKCIACSKMDAFSDGCTKALEYGIFQDGSYRLKLTAECKHRFDGGFPDSSVEQKLKKCCCIMPCSL